MPGEEIDRLRSLLAHAHEQENARPSPVQDSSRSKVDDEVDRLRSLLAHVHDEERTNPFHRLISRITERFAPPIKQPTKSAGNNKKNKAAA